MRRSKIKPSINLASRRSVSSTPQPKEKSAPAAPKLGSPPVVGPVPSAASVTRDGSCPNKALVAKDNSNKGLDTAKAVNIQPDGNIQKVNEQIQNGVSEGENIPPPSVEVQQASHKGSVPAKTKEIQPSVQSLVAPLSSSQSPTSKEAMPPPDSSGSTGKSTPAATRRRRFAAVPNLGQPRLKSVAPKVQNADHAVGRQGPKPGDQTKDLEGQEGRTVMGPPPVQRVLMASSAQKKSESSRLHALTPGTVKPAGNIEDTDSGAAQASPQTTPSSQPTPAGDASTAVTTTTTPSVGGQEGETRRPAPQQSSLPNVYTKKLKELKDQMDEDTPSKRRKRYARSSSPDRTKMTMSDLIYYNPKTNRMKMSEAEKLNRKAKAENNTKKKVTFAEEDEESIDDVDGDSASTDPMAPQVKIGPDGNIIIDQSTLTVEASPARAFDIGDTEIVHEDSSNTTYSSFLKRKRTPVWKPKETARFYKALSAVGTDFGTITAIFPTRSRAEIKRKFKREERLNRRKVDAALSERKELDMSLFDPPSDSEEEEEEASGMTSKKRKSAKRKQVGKAQADEPVGKEDGSKPDDDVIETMSVRSQDSDDESEDALANILSTTRSGRQPKPRTSFTIEIPPKQNRKRTRASPSQKPSAIVYDSYAEHRLKRLEREREATLRLKMLAGSWITREEAEDGMDDARSEATSDMTSEVASEKGNEEEEEIGSREPAGPTSNLEPTRIVGMPGLGAGSANSSSLPESAPETNAAVSTSKKVMLMITTPDGRQTIVQVNLTSTPESSRAQPSVVGVANQRGRIQTSPATSVASTRDVGAQRVSPTPREIGEYPSTSRSSSPLSSPATRLTTLTNVSSPYHRTPLQTPKIRTVVATGVTQPSKQSKNVTVARIVDGKIVFGPPEVSPSPQSEHSAVASRFDSASPVCGDIHTPRDQDLLDRTPLQTLPSHVLQPQPLPNTSATLDSPMESTSTLPSGALLDEQMSAPPMAMAAVSDPADQFLAGGMLPDLGVNMSFDNNLGVVAYEESIATMGDPIVAQQVDVASSNALTQRTRHRHESNGPFIPPMK
ncbi:uncharacterized protein [Diadema setosum]|uniref:uncharacterized protein n=1 Tax=Diadema setosum TaxID=31175 RepID=UPI003B3A2359